MTWLGYQFDSVDMNITIPNDALEEVIDETARWADRDRATKEQFQSLAGKLNYISNCVRPARRFMSQILDALREAHHATTVIISYEVRKDIDWFKRYARQCNARMIIKPKLRNFLIECDACIKGAGGHSNLEYYDLVFPVKYQGFHISQIEALNVVIALKTLIPQDLRGARVTLNTDNIAAMFALSSGRTRDPILAACAREIWLISAVRDIDILILHAPAETLVLADALSRRSLNLQFDDLARSMVVTRKLSRTVHVDFANVLTSNF